MTIKKKVSDFDLVLSFNDTDLLPAVRPQSPPETPNQNIVGTVAAMRQSILRTVFPNADYIESTHADLTANYPPDEYEGKLAWVLTTTGLLWTKKSSGWYISNGSAWVPADAPPSTGVGCISATFDGNGEAIDAGESVEIPMPYAGTIRAWKIIADQTGSIEIDVQRAPFADYPVTGEDTICGGNEPSISVASKEEDTALSGWTAGFAANDVFRFVINSATNIRRCTITLEVDKA